MKKFPFGEVITDVTSKFKKIKQSDYKKNGLFQIIDQGKEPVAGYTDNVNLVNAKLSPIIIFGDHTRALKYLETPIALGADGAKALWVNPQIANSQYVFFYLKSLKLKDAGYSRHFKFLKELEIPIPFKDGETALDDQIRIATLLSRVEALIATRKDNLRLLDEFLKSMFLEMFGEPSKYKKNFPINELGEISPKITDGEHGTVKRLDSGHLYLMARNISRENKIDLSEVSYISETDHKKIYKRCNPEAGDLLLVCVGATIGKVALVPDIGEFSLARSVALIKLNRNVLEPRFLLHLFNSDFVQRQLLSRSNEAAQAGLYIGQLRKIKIPIPQLEVQHHFAAIVEKAESLKSYYQQNLTELENLYGTLSQKAFKGELDLSRVPLAESGMTADNRQAAVNQDQDDTDIIFDEDLLWLPEPVLPRNLPQFFEDFISKQNGVFSLDSFWQDAEQCLLEGMDEDSKPWGVADYDNVKQQLFELINKGKVSQRFNETSNQIELSINA